MSDSGFDLALPVPSGGRGLLPTRDPRPGGIRHPRHDRGSPGRSRGGDQSGAPGPRSPHPRGRPAPPAPCPPLPAARGTAPARAGDPRGVAPPLDPHPGALGRAGRGRRSVAGSGRHLQEPGPLGGHRPPSDGAGHTRPPTPSPGRGRRGPAELGRGRGQAPTGPRLGAWTKATIIPRDTRRWPATPMGPLSGAWGKSQGTTRASNAIRPAGGSWHAPGLGSPHAAGFGYATRSRPQLSGPAAAGRYPMRVPAVVGNSDF